MAYQPQPGYPQGQPIQYGNQPGPYPGQAPPAYPPQPMGVATGGATPAPNVYGMTSPINMTCPNCKNQTTTRCEATISTTQWILYIVLFFFFPICCCAPCYISSCYQVKHNCSTCNHFIGVSQ